MMCLFLFSNAPRTTPSCPKKREGGSRSPDQKAACGRLPDSPTPCSEYIYIYTFLNQFLPKFKKNNFFTLRFMNGRYIYQLQAIDAILSFEPPDNTNDPTSRPKCSAPCNSPRHERTLHSGIFNLTPRNSPHLE